MAITWTEENASQESLNTWTHGLGFALSLPAGVALYQLGMKHQQQAILACVTYSLSLTAMYLFSTLSHAIRQPALRHRIRALDQGFVYTLIAGTFTPFIYSYLEGWPRFALMSFVWIAAGAGFYSKVFAKHRVNNMTSVTYILLGWVPAMMLGMSVTWSCLAIMALGGVLYTAGVAFLQNDHRSWYYHAIWHSMVILASVCHYVAIALFVVLRMDR